jgi:hypothetical protein
MRSFITYSSPNIIRMFTSRRIRWARHVARMGKSSAHRVLVGKPGGKRKLGRRRCVDNIKMDLREKGCGGGRNTNGSGQRLVVGSCEHGNEPSRFIKFWNLCV